MMSMKYKVKQLLRRVCYFGGISLSEIDMNTMKLIKFNNIFAVGKY